MTIRQKGIVSKILIYIVLIVMVIVSLFPIIFCLSASLRTQEDLFQNMFPFSFKALIPTKITFENYVIIFTKYEFWRPILNTVIVTACTIFFGCLVNSIAGFAFTCFEFKGKKILYGLVLISFMVPFESIAIPLYDVANKMKMVDTYAGMIVPAIADGLVAFLFIQFFKDIPVALIEAARVDGASWPRIFLPDYYADFCSDLYYSRPYDIHESVELLYVAIARSEIKGDPHDPDRNQCFQRRTGDSVDVHFCSLACIGRNSDLSVPPVPEIFC